MMLFGMFSDFIGNKVYIGNESCDSGNSLVNTNNSGTHCEKHTEILNNIVKFHFSSLNNKLNFLQLKLYAHKKFPDNTLFLEFRTLFKFFANYLSLNIVLAKWGNGLLDRSLKNFIRQIKSFCKKLHFLTMKWAGGYRFSVCSYFLGDCR